MKDIFVKSLLSKIPKISMPKSSCEKYLKKADDDEGFIGVNVLIDLINKLDYQLKEEEKRLTPKTKFLYIEDGSVDVDALEADLFETNPEIKVIVYRQGSCPPILSEKKDD